MFSPPEEQLHVPLLLHVISVEDSPPPEIIDQVEGEGGHGDQGLAHQEVDVQLLVLLQPLHQPDLVQMLRSDGLVEAHLLNHC